MRQKVLILGCTGLLGHILLSQLMKDDRLDVYATSRLKEIPEWFPRELSSRVRKHADAENIDSIIRALASVQPDVVINCIGLIKQQPISSDPLSAITINSLLPHRISMICSTSCARMIHISTDCVFNGRKGNYFETDPSDAEDLYGRSKYLGEVSYPHCVTLRTSIIGHELKGKLGLVEWFLSQQGKVSGYTHAIYSGFPAVEIARIISQYVLPNSQLSGVYHVSSEPISKYDLLKMIAKKYDKDVTIEPDDSFNADRSLDSSVFRKATGYKPPNWQQMIDMMYDNYLNCHYYHK
jgi:dTDP-4-dehydrorhamnose reductase